MVPRVVEHRRTLAGKSRESSDLLLPYWLGRVCSVAFPHSCADPQLCEA